MMYRREDTKTMQLTLFNDLSMPVPPLRSQLLKWIGNKQRFAHEIVSLFPASFDRYFEPFLGSGAVLATLAPMDAIGSDIFPPLIQIWRTLRQEPAALKQWYEERWRSAAGERKAEAYERIRDSYNRNPNGPDLLFLCRSCYGGVVRFRQSDGYMSTPCGIHTPIPPEAFARRVDEWHARTMGAQFLELHYQEAMQMARPGDLIYCDPPYRHSQGILYRGQTFRLEDLLETIDRCRRRGVYVALSIDGTKKSGDVLCKLPIPDGFFKREFFVNCGRSMLKRFQMGGKTLEREIVADRLLLTY